MQKGYRHLRLLVIAVLLVPAAALALPPEEPSSADLSLAKRHYALGESFYNRAAYEKALDEFSKAYGLSRRPELLFNMGRCLEGLGKLTKAIDHYQRFLAAKGPNPEVDARIENLKQRVARRKAQQRQNQATEDQKKPPKPLPSSPAPRRSIHWSTITGWSLVGLGAASLVAGIAMGALANQRAGEVEDAYSAGADWADTRSIEDEGKNFNVGMIVGVSVGIAAAAGGAALLLFYPKQERRLSGITPIVHPKMAGLSAAWRF